MRAQIVTQGMAVDQLEHNLTSLRWRAGNDPIGDRGWSGEPAAPVPFPSGMYQPGLAHTLLRQGIAAADAGRRKAEENRFDVFDAQGRRSVMDRDGL